MTTNNNLYENGGACETNGSIPDCKINVNQLKETVLPAISCDPAAIGKYDQNRSAKEDFQELSNFMEKGTVSAMAIKIGEIVTKLTDADPRKETIQTVNARALRAKLTRQPAGQPARSLLSHEQKEPSA